jgi:hypothetical protein
VLVEFNRAPGYGDNVQVEMDVVPRKGETVFWDGRSHAVRSVTWFLNDVDEGPPTAINPTVRVGLSADVDI